MSVSSAECDRHERRKIIQTAKSIAGVSRFDFFCGVGLFVTNFPKKADDNLPFLMDFQKSSDHRKPFTALGFSNIVPKSPTSIEGLPVSLPTPQLQKDLSSGLLALATVQRCLMKEPACSSAIAWRSCSWVFITMGPYHATGSSMGLPDTSKKRIPWSPALTSISSPRSNSTSE
jgi:hypothetical protein